MDNNYLDHEEWRLTLTHSYIDKDGSRIRLDEPLMISIVQPFGRPTEVVHAIYDRLMFEMKQKLEERAYDDK